MIMTDTIKGCKKPTTLQPTSGPWERLAALMEKQLPRLVFLIGMDVALTFMLVIVYLFK